MISFQGKKFGEIFHFPSALVASSSSFQQILMSASEESLSSSNSINSPFHPQNSSRSFIESQISKLEKSDFPLLITDLPSEISENEIKDLFEKYGKVKSISFLSANIYGISKDDVLIVMSDKEAGRKAMMEMNKRFIFPAFPAESKPIGVKYFDEEHYNPRKLYISHIPEHASEDDLRSIFSPFGTIESITVLKRPDGANKGCGFIKFTSNDSAVKAIQELHHAYQMDGSSYNLIVKFASRNDIRIPNIAASSTKSHQTARKRISRPNNPQQPIYAYEAPSLSSNPIQPQTNANFGDYLSYYQAFYALQQVQQKEANSSQAAQTFEAGTKPAKRIRTNFLESSNPLCNLYVGNIPVQYSENDLESMFSPFGTVKCAYLMAEKGSDLSKGCGFVSFEDEDSASSAIKQLDGMIIGGKKLKVSLKKRQTNSII